MATEEQKTNYLISQMGNVYLRDIILRYSVKDEAALGEVINVIASGISSLTNPRKIADTMNSVHGNTTCASTIDKYIGYAEEAFILNRVKRYNVKGSLVTFKNARRDCMFAFQGRCQVTEIAG